MLCALCNTRCRTPTEPLPCLPVLLAPSSSSTSRYGLVRPLPHTRHTQCTKVLISTSTLHPGLCAANDSYLILNHYSTTTCIFTSLVVFNRIPCCQDQPRFPLQVRYHRFIAQIIHRYSAILRPGVQNGRLLRSDSGIADQMDPGTKAVLCRNSAAIQPGPCQCQSQRR